MENIKTVVRKAKVRKPKWHKPKIIILLRGRVSPEAVLSYCKGDMGSGHSGAGGGQSCCAIASYCYDGCESVDWTGS